jgi:hypothetical protein
MPHLIFAVNTDSNQPTKPQAIHEQSSYSMKHHEDDSKIQGLAFIIGKVPATTISVGWREEENYQDPPVVEYI